MSFIEDLQRSFRLADAFDILIVSIFLYSALAWFKEAASRPVLIGVSVLAVIYFAARAFGMYMTAMVFQAFVAVVLVALVVVFQEDLRRAFARIGAVGQLRRRYEPILPDPSALVETAADLARRHVGALIVLRPREPLDRHIHGGILLNGEISRPLLDSIFDPHSMGHDGAVLIERDRISRFAAHLPLTERHQAVGQRGTRHAAAVGLSERCDALVIVVSEERGQISVAQNGKLYPIDTPAELQGRIDRFYEQNFPQQSASLAGRLLRENGLLKVLSIVVACVAWFVLSFRPEMVQQTFVMPIEFRNVPESLVIERSDPLEARVTLSGRKRAFDLAAPGASRISIDLSDIEQGQFELAMEPSDVQTSPGLSVYRIEPPSVQLTVEPRPK